MISTGLIRFNSKSSRNGLRNEVVPSAGGLFLDNRPHAVGPSASHPEPNTTEWDVSELDEAECLCTTNANANTRGAVSTQAVS